VYCKRLKKVKWHLTEFVLIFEMFTVLKIRLLHFGLWNFSVIYFVSSASPENTASIFREYGYTICKINLQVVFCF